VLFRSGDLSSLTALHTLLLEGACTGLTPAARLPPSLTSLYLGANVHHEIGGVINDELPAQVGSLCRQLWHAGQLRSMLHCLYTSCNLRCREPWTSQLSSSACLPIPVRLASPSLSPRVHHMLQVAGLTRLHVLHLSSNTFRSDRFGSLAALGSTLQSLCLENKDSLPDCLPQMLALRTPVRGSGALGMCDTHGADWQPGLAVLHAAAAAGRPQCHVK